MLRRKFEQRQFVRRGRQDGRTAGRDRRPGRRPPPRPRRRLPAPPGAVRVLPGGTGTTARLAPASSIIYTAQLTVRAGNVSSAAAQAAQIAESAGGYVSSETASANPDHPSEATASVQLKIPVASYSGTLGQLASRLGTQLVPAAAGPGRHPAGGRREQPGHLGRGGHRPAPRPAVARGLGRRPAQRAEPDQRRGIQPGVHAGPAARPQPRDQLRDGDAHPARPEGQAAGAPPEGAAHPGGRLRRWLARAACHRVLDARLPRRDSTVRRHPGRRRIRDLPQPTLADPPQAGRTVRLPES